MTYPAKGDRIELIAMRDEPDPLPPGATGTVENVRSHDFGPRDQFDQIWVKWDAPHAHRTLMLSVPPDSFRVIT
jgi:hypothetical protein